MDAVGGVVLTCIQRTSYSAGELNKSLQKKVVSTFYNTCT